MPVGRRGGELAVHGVSPADRLVLPLRWRRAKSTRRTTAGGRRQIVLRWRDASGARPVLRETAAGDRPAVGEGRLGEWGHRRHDPGERPDGDRRRAGVCGDGRRGLRRGGCGYGQAALALQYERLVPERSDDVPNRRRAVCRDGRGVDRDCLRDLSGARQGGVELLVGRSAEHPVINEKGRLHYLPSVLNFHPFQCLRIPLDVDVFVRHAEILQVIPRPLGHWAPVRAEHFHVRHAVGHAIPAPSGEGPDRAMR